MFRSKDDATLVTEALGGSERAWHTLVRRYEKRLYNHAWRLSGNPDDAFDITQDVFMSVYRNLSTYTGRGAFASWLFRITTFRTTDHLRKRRASVVSLDSERSPAAAAPASEPTLALDHTRDNRDLLKMMTALPFEQRQVIELKFFQGFTFDEISRQLGVSTNTAKTRAYAALRKMKPAAMPGDAHQCL